MSAAAPVETHLINLRNQRLLRVEKMFFVARWIAIAFAIVQTVTYYRPYPDGYEALSFAAIGALALANVVLWLVAGRVRTDRQVVQASVAGMAIDVAFIQTIIFIFAFDYDTAIWALLYLVPILGATRFQLRGAVVVTAASSVLYIGREIYASHAYGFELLPQSISFRLGIAWILAWTTGMMANTFTKETIAAEKLNSHLAQMNNTMSEFVAITSHEMRTPITVISGMTKVLRSDWHELPDEQRQQMMQAVARQADSLDLLVEDLLASSQIDAGSLNTKPELIDAFQALARDLEQLAIDGVQLDVQSGLSIFVDPNHFSRTVSNLVTNADKYGEQPIHVVVRQEGEDAVLVVRDSGGGVPSEFVPRLFERFTRETGASQGNAGTGLGLSIVKGLVEASNGTVTYQDANEGGAEFIVRYKGAVSAPDSVNHKSVG